MTRAEPKCEPLAPGSGLAVCEKLAFHVLAREILLLRLGHETNSAFPVLQLLFLLLPDQELGIPKVLGFFDNEGSVDYRMRPFGSQECCAEDRRWEFFADAG